MEEATPKCDFLGWELVLPRDLFGRFEGFTGLAGRDNIMRVFLLI